MVTRSNTITTIFELFCASLDFLISILVGFMDDDTTNQFQFTKISFSLNKIINKRKKFFTNFFKISSYSMIKG